MKKRIEKMLGMVACMLVMMMTLAGCVKMDTEITVHNNGSADITMLYAYMDALTQSMDMSELMPNETIANLKAKGLSVEDYNQDGYTGYLISGQNLKLSDMMQDDNGVIGGDSFKVEKKGNTYKLTWKMDPSDASQMDGYKPYINMYGGYAKLTLNLPRKPINHNAASVSADGKTLTWDLLNLGPDQTIMVEFKAGLPLYLIPIIAVALMLLIIIVVAVLLGSKRKSPALEAQDAYTVAGAMGFSAEQEAPAQPVMNFCPSCGKPLGEGVFCQHCGTKVR